MKDRKKIEQAIETLEDQRGTLGDSAVDPAIEGLRQRLAEMGLDEQGSVAFEGERKMVTVMFADIAGFTAMSESMDPEGVRDIINSCFERLVLVIERYGGTVEKFIGDAIMAIFGAPLAHENDPERALRAALDMMDALMEFNSDRNTALGMHIGINTGRVVAGGIGIRGHQQYGVMGDAVNVAARLEDASEKGEILVGQDTYRLTAQLFGFETLNPIPVKGKTDPVQVYRLDRVKTKPTFDDGFAAQEIAAPFVGREAEVQAFNDCVDRLITGQGGIISIVGEAGLGKSRLIAEIHEGIPADRLFWLEAHTLSFGQTISYLPFQGILRQIAGFIDDDTEEVAWRKLESRIRELFPEQSAEILPYLASVLSLEAKGEYAERIKYLDGEAMGRQVFLASRRFFEQLALSHPLLIVFEDLHQVDESSKRLIEHITPLIEHTPLLICYVTRPYSDTFAAQLLEFASKNYPDHYTEISLSPLSRSNSTQLVANLLKIENMPSRIQETILSRADGNPFFLEEIIRSLVASGAVVRESATAQWQATSEIASISIPDTIQGIIMARVDSLEERIKHTLRTAAVIGQSFLYRVLRAVTETVHELDNHLNELMAVELVKEKQLLPELEYIFKHALAQEAVYESILLQKRRELHARVGKCLEELFADRLEEIYGLLAYHYTNAEVWEKAQHFLLKAGDQAGKIAADAEALSHYEHAVAAYERAFGDKWDSFQRASLERKMGDAFFRRGEHEQALAYFERALTYLGERLPKSKLGVRSLILIEAFKQLCYRIFPGIFLKPMSEHVSPEVKEIAGIYGSMGWITVFSDLERYLLSALRYLNFCEREGYALEAVLGYTGLGLIFDFMPNFRIAGSYHQRALVLLNKLDHPRVTGDANHIMALHELFQGKLDSAKEYGQLAVEAYNEAGFIRGWGSALFHTVARPQIYRGEFSDALSYGQELARCGYDCADLQVESWGLFAKGFAQERMGKMEQAIATLTKNMEIAKAVPDHMICIEMGSLLSKCYLRNGDLDGALAAMEESQEIRDKYNERKPPALTLLLNGWARVHLWAAENGGNGEKGKRLKLAKKACQAAIKHSNTYRFGLSEAQRLRGRYEWLKGRSGLAETWWERSLSTSEEMGTRYELGKTHQEMGKRMGNTGHQTRSENILAKLGVEPK